MEVLPNVKSSAASSSASDQVQQELREIEEHLSEWVLDECDDFADYVDHDYVKSLTFMNLTEFAEEGVVYIGGYCVFCALKRVKGCTQCQDAIEDPEKCEFTMTASFCCILMVFLEISFFVPCSCLSLL
jgi:hypothetical protein